jgi:hypothetical protein
MKRIFTVPVIYECVGTIKVKATTLQEAIQIVAEQQPLPENATPLMDTYEVDIGAVPFHNPD